MADTGERGSRSWDRATTAVRGVESRASRPGDERDGRVDDRNDDRASGGRSGERGAATTPRAVPITQTAAYEFHDADRVAATYALEHDDDVYTRISNPTTRALERRTAALAGGTDAVATASGMAALDALVTVLASAGDTIVAAEETYGGTATYLTTIADRRGVDVRWVDPTAPTDVAEGLAAADDPALLHAETIANPSLSTPDLSRLADVAHDHHVPFVVDNTFATPALCRPIDHGADAVWTSTTKWFHGAGTTVGGVVIDGGTFPWDHPDAEYPELAGENPAFGIDFSERFGERALATAVRHRAVRTLGNGQSPFDAWQTLQGVETLPARMDQHCSNAERVARFLREHPRVSWVRYPGFEDHPTHESATEYLDGYGGTVVFGVAGGYEAARGVCEATEVIGFMANVGDTRSLIVHPASTTHANVSPAERRAAGVTDATLRLSVGIESADDVIADLDRALEVAT